MFGPQMANHTLGGRRPTPIGEPALLFLRHLRLAYVSSLNFPEDFANMVKACVSTTAIISPNSTASSTKSLKIDPKSKQVVFSNALNVDKAIAIRNMPAKNVLPSFGIGTHTNDFDGADEHCHKLIAVKIPNHGLLRLHSVS